MPNIKGKRKWKGVLSRDIRTFYDFEAGKPYTFKKGQIVTVWKKKQYDENGIWRGKYEYHYSDENGRGLCRMDKLYLEGQED